MHHNYLARIGGVWSIVVYEMDANITSTYDN